MAVGFPAKTNFATGDVLTATNMNDVTGTLNLLESAQYSAGKNKIINGDFGIWQRGTSVNITGVGNYSADRWTTGYMNAVPTSATISRQTFTPGTAPVAGYEGTYYARSTITTVGSTTIYRALTQRIEDVRTLAGNNITVTFWAKADSARTLSVAWQQVFGSGGSADVSSALSTFNLTTSWQRFTWNTNLSSISGKTIGTNSYVELLFQQAAASGSILDVWGVQLEVGSTASPFQTASGSIGGELALCQRYYFRTNSTTTFGALASTAWAQSATLTEALVRLPVTMRVAPTTFDGGTVSNTSFVNYAGSTFTLTGGATITTAQTTTDTVKLLCGSTGMTAGHVGNWAGNASGYFGFGAEL